MSLTGSTNEEKIFNYLKSKGLNDFGACGLMGNLKAESGLRPNNLQNSYETKLKLSDTEYTSQVDSGSYTNFVRDSAGYGLAQWTYWSRKQNLLNFAKNKKKSIGDLEMQLDFLYKELSEGYTTILTSLKSATSILQASNVVLLQFERPANQGESVQKQRAQYGQEYYDTLSKSESKGGSTMSNSSLVTCTVKSPNHSGARTHSIDRITPHCVVGQLSASGIGGCFTNSSRKASCNYGIGTEGGVCLVVDEANKSWCSSSNENDQRAVTIECASDKTEPYTMNTTVYNKLVELCVDICKRNGKKKLLWFSNKDTSLNYSPKSDEMVLTVHRWFANKSCPGNWLYARMDDLAKAVTTKLGGSTVSSTPTTDTSSQGIKTLSGTVKNIYTGSDGLNVREAPSMSGKVNQVIHGGTFTVVGISADGEWYKLKSGLYLTTNEKYVKFTETATPTAATSGTYMVRVTNSALNIRSGPGVNYGKVGCITDKGSYTIVQTSGNWGKLKSGAGWICLDYTKKI